MGDACGQFPPEDHTTIVSAATAEVVLASATELEEGGSAPPWRPGDENASQVLFGVISSRSTLSGPWNEGQRFAHLQSIIYNDIRREEFGRARQHFGGGSPMRPTRSRRGCGSSSRSPASLRRVETVGVGLRGHGMLQR